MRKIAAAKAMTDVIKYAALCRITRLASFRPREFTLTREVRTTEDASPKFAYLVLRNTRRPNVKSPDYLPNLLCSLDRDGNADSNHNTFGVNFTQQIGLFI